MLIPFKELLITKPIKGIIHIGSHECEERSNYIDYFHINDSQIIWIDAIYEKVQQMKQIFPSIIIYNECISNIDNEDVSFMITNNYESSSMLNFKTHSIEHPSIVETHRIKLKTKTLNTLFNENNLVPSNYNFMNLDIQGAELMALEGSTNILPYIDYIYCEVNIKELYENCALIDQIDSFLLTYNFKRIQTSITKHGWGDAFYINTNLLVKIQNLNGETLYVLKQQSY